MVKELAPSHTAQDKRVIIQTQSDFQVGVLRPDSVPPLGGSEDGNLTSLRG